MDYIQYSNILKSLAVSSSSTYIVNKAHASKHQQNRKKRLNRRRAAAQTEEIQLAAKNCDHWQDIATSTPKSTSEQNAPMHMVTLQGKQIKCRYVFVAGMWLYNDTR